MVLLINNTFVFNFMGSKDLDPPQMDNQNYNNTEIATFGLGCFWGAESKFGVIPGVIKTSVGYAGGNKKDPSYYNLGNHTETVQITYNPEKVSYRRLLEVFWNSHNPTIPKKSSQYQSLILYHNKEQEEIARKSKIQHQTERTSEIQTKIKELNKYYLAEDYHQKYNLKDEGGLIIGEFKDMYPESNLVNSTAAAKVNGYIVGYGNRDKLEESISDFGLTSETQEKLIELFDNRS